MISYLDEVLYCKETEFSNERLIQLMSAFTVRLFFFGNIWNEQSGRRGEAKTKVEINICIEFWKKMLSSFMPNCLMHWDNMGKKGNPTRSIAI